MFDRNSTGIHTDTLKSLLTLKEEIRARDPLFYVYIDITYSLIDIVFSLYLLTLYARKSFDFQKVWFGSIHAIYSRIALGLKEILNQRLTWLF